MNVLIVNESSLRAPRKFIADWCKLIEKEFQKRKLWKSLPSQLELTVVFLDTAAAKKMNQQFRNRNYATDVLSFEGMEPGALGELVLCPQVLRRQCKEHHLTYHQELGYMLLHGILHLLGYDHELSESDAKKMFLIQDQVFEKLLTPKKSTAR
ncbi:MAG: rRNA maturation RNase YbeY [Proteobacteria bacterium]|nr:MAG: rRNA maturation RNase YbeY [Pseudomonadota bacterium]